MLVYPFFESTRLLSKKVPHWSLLLCFFRLSKYEKPPSFPSLGSWNLHRRMLPLCVLSTAFAYLTYQSSNSFPLRLNTFGHWGIFPEYHFPRTSVLFLCLKLVCLQYLLLHCNVIFLYSFSEIIKKNKKNQIYPKKRMGKVFSFYGSTMSRPWTKHILLFVCQSLGFNMTLGSCSRNIELCPPQFGYPSKHMESLCCLLHHELMSMSCFLSLIIFCDFFQGNFTQPESAFIHFVSWYSWFNHPKSIVKSIFKIDEVLYLIIEIL